MSGHKVTEGGLTTVRGAAPIGSITEPLSVVVISVLDLPSWNRGEKEDFEVVLGQDTQNGFWEGTVSHEIGRKIAVGDNLEVLPVKDSHIPSVKFL
jgi:hypothetical protein